MLVYKSKLKIELLRSQSSDFKDPEKKVSYKKDSYKHFNQHISHIEIKNDEDLDYAVLIIQQLYERISKEYYSEE
ncbi:MAG: hypothetical protein WD579_02510 [Candidatus Paceibacterota bacterium]